MTIHASSADFSTPVSLILRLRQGKDTDWRMFWDIYGPVVYRLARRDGMNHHDAQDIVCEVMRGLHARIRRGMTVDPSKGRFRGYVARCVRNSTLRFRRRFGKGDRTPPRGPAADEVVALDGDLASLERRELVRACLDRLRDSPDVRRRDYEAFVQYVIEDQPAGAVAKRFGLSTGRVFGIRSELVGRLRAQLAEWAGGA